ncbi:Isy1-like splicing family-domain-containing protein [Pisolithus croceorrhizus]|nr:Isy1-like splicing family-domain-containing protein [Pisolithus croceorrhizus]KAI6109446.1 Isy1-like splicing family-domain-containing protein [Pisolithus croceorrhizus]KAI6152873.1 Isy1-like splicing family-domain-containing protein [Pisolithus thermaeus]
MLYRFREAQAAELGLGTRADRRPKMASACKSLRECERWRGEILREISRKVSKIQDSGLTDYEVRDLNDEINKLLREKRHWENQIISLGGANYRRNVAMLDDDGKEVPGTKGYKYFGRAKDLPGVRDLFQSKKKEEEEENVALNYYKKFMNQGPAYYGDLDETQGVDGVLVYEQKVEETEWKEAYERVRDILGLPVNEPIPEIPRSASASTGSSSSSPSIQNQPSTPSPPHSDPSSSQAKRKASDAADTDLGGVADGPDTRGMKGTQTKRSKIAPLTASTGSVPASSSDPVQDASRARMTQHAQLAASYIPFLTPEALMPPTLPTRAETEEVLLSLRKEALVQEFFGTDAEGAA